MFKPNLEIPQVDFTEDLEQRKSVTDIDYQNLIHKIGKRKRVVPLFGMTEQ